MHIQELNVYEHYFPNSLGPESQKGRLDDLHNPHLDSQKLTALASRM